MFKNLKIGPKLSLGFGCVLALVLVLAGVTLERIGAAVEEWNVLSEVALKKQDAAGDAASALGAGIHYFKNYVIRGGDYDRKFESSMQRIERALAGYVALGAPSAAEAEEIRKAGEAVKNYRVQMNKLTGMRAQGATVAELDQAVAGGDKPLAAALDRLHDTARTQVAKDGADVIAALASARVVVLGTSAAILLAGVLFTLMITRAITRPLREAVRVARTVAAGDLTVRVQARGKDETAELLAALRDMGESLARVVGQVRLSTDSIATAAGQIASGNQDLSQRTEEQASSLEETAASMEEFTGTVQQSAASARQANELAKAASETAAGGGALVQEVVQTMRAISESSRKIAEITALIDGIAFQTNILALNAAVEAARAGEQGRGFAVVASEVRSLAQRSAAAAREIKGLIDESVAKVDAGGALVARAGVTMGEIVGGTQRVTAIMGEIAAATQEQSAGIEQVSEAVAQMDRVTQQNAALVEEASGAAQAMREQADELVAAVSLFKLDTDARAAQVISKVQRRGRAGSPMALPEPAQAG